ncbi:FG-GAP repeat protein [Endozoicomonas arenosclerae]|uniref:FG-GAP repeat protein n=1 Tax=Endozoicomonas arenosclerae TaxID=1633495 RepID=UPI00078087E1|nr:FG-GAP repeat protein [Endozoicomonas arenosclerae]
MALPESGRLMLSQIAEEFDNTPPIRFSNFIQYAGSRFSDFYGASSSPWKEEQLLQPTDYTKPYLLDWSVAISDDGATVAIGTPEESTGESTSGAVYIFAKNQDGEWGQQAKLKASTLQSNARFGLNIDLSGDGNTLISSAQQEDTSNTNTGSVYIFRRSGSVWSEQAKLSPDNLWRNAQLGSSVSMNKAGDAIAVGAPYQYINNKASGSVFIFTFSDSSWNQVAEVTSEDAESNDYFGGAVVINDDANTVAVGAWGEGTAASKTGAAYVFAKESSNWEQQAKILHDDLAADDQFGKQLALNAAGDTLLAGSSRQNNNLGAVYVYQRNNSVWTLQQRLNPDGSENPESFGCSVSLNPAGTEATIGAKYERSETYNSGALYFFELSDNTWAKTHVQKLNTPKSNGYFGYAHSVSRTGNSIVAANKESHSEGGVYIFQKKK